jgi:RNA 2',3'-cyclic 3'-phosphodiesterase
MSPDDESWRLFIAIELPSNLRRALTDHIDLVRAAVPEAKASWACEENLHLTMKFLGDTEPARVEGISQAIQRSANAVRPFAMNIEGGGAFPPSGQPRVLWIGVEDPSGQLASLHRRLEDECEKVGFAREQRPFRPHLTIARIRNPKGARHLFQVHKEMSFDGETFAVSHLALIRSEFRSEGSRHTVVARYQFSQE